MLPSKRPLWKFNDEWTQDRRKRADFLQCRSLIFLKHPETGEYLMFRCHRAFRHRRRMHRHRIQNEFVEQIIQMEWVTGHEGTHWDPRPAKVQQAWADGRAKRGEFEW